MRRSLVIEDNPLHADMMSATLGALGFQVETCRDGEDFRIALEQDKPSLVVMDVRLPGVSGLTLSRQLKDDERFRDIPILMVTALALTADDHKVRASGCDGFLEKPFAPADFIAEVERLVPMPS